MSRELLDELEHARLVLITVKTRPGGDTADLVSRAIDRIEKILDRYDTMEPASSAMDGETQVPDWQRRRVERLGKFIYCRGLNCPEAEWSSKVAERGWRAQDDGFFCPSHR